MASNVQIDGKEYQVYQEEEYRANRGAGFWGSNEPDNILIARSCIRCGDQLLGTPTSLQNAKPPRCEFGHCHSRPGVRY